jgi:5-hydroxyisourate hydrolase
VITTHVLDSARGEPARGVGVVLEACRHGDWVRLSSGTTDDRGRLIGLTDQISIEPGRYRLTFDTGAYQRERGATSFYPDVQITFDIQDAGEHVHVPLVVSPFGYSTYRGT